MADSDSTRFSCFDNIGDDSPFVHRAMDQLGFCCEFCDLHIADMQMILALALHIKLSGQFADTWES